MEGDRYDIAQFEHKGLGHPTDVNRFYSNSTDYVDKNTDERVEQ